MLVAGEFINIVQVSESLQQQACECIQECLHELEKLAQFTQLRQFGQFCIIVYLIVENCNKSIEVNSIYLPQSTQSKYNLQNINGINEYHCE